MAVWSNIPEASALQSLGVDALLTIAVLLLVFLACMALLRVGVAVADVFERRRVRRFLEERDRHLKAAMRAEGHTAFAPLSRMPADAGRGGHASSF